MLNKMLPQSSTARCYLGFITAIVALQTAAAVAHVVADALFEAA